MIKLFASDLDGTLLNIDHQTDETILNGINEIKNAGRIFVVATGRTMHSGEIKRLNLENNVIIACNGATILDKNQNIICSFPLDAMILSELMQLFPNAFFAYMGDNIAYVHKSKEQTLIDMKYGPYKAILENEESITRFFDSYVFDVPYEEILQKKIYEIYGFFTSAKDQERFESYLKDHKEQIVNGPTRKNFYEITSSFVNKGYALEKFIEMMHISKDEVMVFGDNENDLEMLKRFKHSYVPSNATDIAKEAANHIIGSNKDHSVINKMLETIKEDCIK